MYSRKTLLLAISAATLVALGVVFNLVNLYGAPVFTGNLYDRIALNAGLVGNYLKYKRSIDSEDYNNIREATDAITAERNHALETPSLRYDELLRIDAYYNLSRATLYVADELPEYSRLYPLIKKTIDYLNSYRVDDALSLYVSIKGRIIKVLTTFRKAYNILNSTRIDYFPEKHRANHLYLEKEVKKAIEFLEEYLKLMDILLMNREHLKGNSVGAYLSLKSSSKILGEIDLSKLGELGKEVSDFLTRMRSEDNGVFGGGNGGSSTGSYINQTGSQNNNNNNLGSGGVGGGPGGPVSDD